MRREVLIAIIGIIVVIGGIFVYRSLGSSNEPIPPIPPTGGNSTNCTSHRDEPLSTSFVINPGMVLEKAVAPAYFQFGSVIPKATIDTWTENSSVIIGKETICYLAGDPLWLLLYNGTDIPTTFQLEVVNAPDVSNYFSVTGLSYQKAPSESLIGVVVPSPVTVGARSCQKVPVKITLPDLTYPSLWEYRIKVTTLEVSGQVTTGLEIRLFYSMR